MRGEPPTLAGLFDARFEQVLQPRFKTQAVGEIVLGFSRAALLQLHESTVRVGEGAARLKLDGLSEVADRAVGKKQRVWVASTVSSVVVPAWITFCTRSRIPPQIGTTFQPIIIKIGSHIQNSGYGP
jgi:hypothetical protein